MNSSSTMLRPIAALLTGLALAASAQAQGVLDTKKGQGGSEVQGAAGTQGAQGAAGDLEHCDKPMGAMAVVEPQDYMMGALRALQPAVAGRPDPHDDPAVELLHRRRARRRACRT